MDRCFGSRGGHLLHRCRLCRRRRRGRDRLFHNSSAGSQNRRKREQWGKNDKFFHSWVELFQAQFDTTHVRRCVSGENIYKYFGGTWSEATKLTAPCREGVSRRRSF